MTRAALRDVDATPVAWREAGPADGEVILFLHGLGGTRTAWDPQLEAMAALAYRCAAWDMPGYGCSATLPELTFGSLTDAFFGWMDALGVRSAHVVGLSMGAMVAQHVALRDQRRLRSLVLIDTSPAFGMDGTTTAAQWIDQRLGPLRAGATPASIATQLFRGIMAPGASDEAVTAAAASMGRISTTGLAAAVHCLVTHDTRGRLSTITTPTLVVVGEHDRETPRAYAESLATAVPGARLEQVPGAGHVSNLEAPEAVNRLLETFIAATPEVR